MEGEIDKLPIVRKHDRHFLAHFAEDPRRLMATARISSIGTIAATLVLGTSLASCLRPPTQAAPLTNNVGAAPVAAGAPATPAASVKVRQVQGLPSSFVWTSSDPVIVPKAADGLDIVAIKDPSIVRYKDRYHVYASSVARGGIYGMVYLSFADWTEAPKATFYPMKKTPGFDTYVAAPQLFYFSPKKLWYLVFQSGPPMYSTSEDPSDPTKWTPPMPFYPRQPKSIDENGWLDFWVICDSQSCHLFFSDDHGRWYKSKTSIDRFPRGFGEPVVVMEDAEAGRLFEACNVYKIKGSDKYLALVEAFDKSSSHRRYFRSWTADSLEGPWMVLHDDADAPFAGSRNVSFAGTPWSDDISHGELVRDGYDETMVIDGSHLQFVYQGFPSGSKTSDYNAIPWQLGLLTAK
jgi:endo-1,4-beta-xylanase